MVEAPIVEAPIVDPPIVDPPIVGPPIVEAAIVDPPMVDPPIVAPPIVAPPIADPPMVERVGAAAMWLVELSRVAVRSLGCDLVVAGVMVLAFSLGCCLRRSWCSWSRANLCFSSIVKLTWKHRKHAHKLIHKLFYIYHDGCMCLFKTAREFSGIPDQNYLYWHLIFFIHVYRVSYCSAKFGIIWFQMKYR